MNTQIPVYGALIDASLKQTQEHFEDRNPANGEIIALIGRCTEADLNEAVESGQSAFTKWKAVPRDKRSRLLNQIADIIERDMDELVLNETLDTGKCLSESALQLQICADIYRYFAGAIMCHEDIMIQHASGSFSAVIREPLGVAGLILPWNAPSMLMTWKLAPALAAGNCAVVKPASAASRVVLELALRFQEVLPPGVLNVVTGSGSEIGNALAYHPGISKVSFTGSTTVGSGIGRICGENVVPCTLELGGKSANIIFEDADLDRAVQYVMIGILSTSGEVCVAGSRLLVQDSIYERMVEMLREKFIQVTVGDPTAPDTKMGPVIDESQGRKIMDCIDGGLADGARLVCGGHRLTGGIYDLGFFIEPTIFADADNSMRIAREEIFGPVLTIIPFQTEAEAVSIANDSAYGLGAAVWTRDIYRAIRVSRVLQAGTVWVNDYLDSSPGNPFGGYKKSGIGREIHKMAMDYYSNVKNICVSATDEVPAAF